MLKGVNKLIVDVANPDSEFFERAIFFVKPQMKDTPPNRLNKSADTLIYEQSRRKKSKGFTEKSPIAIGLVFAGAAGLGAAVTAIVLSFL